MNQPVSRRHFMASSLTAGAALAALPRSPLGAARAAANQPALATAGGGVRARRPNILFVYVDQQRPDWLGCAGEFPEKIPVITPHLDRLAANGVRFTNAVCPAPVCAASRNCLASGAEYHNNGGNWGNSHCFPMSRLSFYAHLRDAGYHVLQAGKLDLTKGLDIPFVPTTVKPKHGKTSMLELGFSDMLEVIGKWAGEGAWGGRFTTDKFPIDPYEIHLQAKGLFEAYRDDFMTRDRLGDRAYTDPAPLEDADYKDNWITERLIEMVARVPGGKPWFAQLNLDNPHGPNDITKRMEGTVRGRDMPRPFKVDSQFTSEKHVAMRQNYTAQVENNDRLVGRFLEYLRQSGQFENTLVVFSADHGEMMGDHGLFGKGKWYWQSSHVPLIISGPGVLSGRVISAPATNMDLAATFLEYAGVPTPADMDSRSMKGLIEGKTSSHRDHVLSGLGMTSNGWRMAYDGRYKLIKYTRKGTLHLYDRQTDPYETSDVAAQHPAVVTRLAARFAEERPMTPEPFIVIKRDPEGDAHTFNVHAGAVGNVARPVQKVELYHNGVKIDEKPLNLAIANIKGLTAGRHVFKVVVDGEFTKEMEFKP
jgi:arylsulfatase A-like enzyme